LCEILAPLASRILLAPVSSDRSASPQAMRDFCEALDSHAEVVACASLTEALNRTATDPLVLITGSLHFVGEAIEVLHLSSSPALNERGLNEWTGVRELRVH